MSVAAGRFAPTYRLAINGRDLPAAVRECVQSVRYIDGDEGSDQVEFTLANPGLRFLGGHIRGLSLAAPTGVSLNTFARTDSGDTLFDLDIEVRLALGYAPDPPTELFLGEITGVGATFPGGGMPTVTVTAHDFLQRAMRGSVSRGFGPLPDAAIIAILSLENGLIPLIDPAMVPLDVINTVGNVLFGSATQQHRVSDHKLLTAIAAKYGMKVSVDRHTLWVNHYIKEYSPRMTLTYGRDLIDFAPRVTTVGEALGFSMRIILREVRIELIVKVYWDVDRESVGITILPAIAAIVAPAFGKPTKASRYQTIRNAIDVANTVVGLLHELRDKLNNRLTGTGTAVGDPNLRAGALIRLEGLGYDFSGNYRVTKATHTLDAGSGYRTSFDAQREVIP